MRGELPEIRRRGAELVIIGNGSPHMAEAFIEDLGIDSPVYTDPSRKAYAAAGFERGVLATFSPRAVLHGTRAFREGFRQTKLQGDGYQLGGVIVVAKGGEILYGYASREAGDHPPASEILSALPAAG